mmetsp:Transcript_28143/g.48826  ORF Transcript_28143/g.48826 Transcript_28143/m.48826 type:complete len:633 (-) Transcript_28143:351-2249(-)
MYTVYIHNNTSQVWLHAHLNGQSKVRPQPRPDRRHTAVPSMLTKTAVAAAGATSLVVEKRAGSQTECTTAGLAHTTHAAEVVGGGSGKEGPVPGRHPSLLVHVRARLLRLADAQLEVGNVPLVAGDPLLVADPDLLRHLRDQAHVVRDQHQAALELGDGPGQRVDGLHVQVVGGLIQQQQVRGLLGHLGEDHARLLPVREVLDQLCLHGAGHAVPAQVRACLVSGHVRVDVHEVVQWALVLVQDVHEVLRELGDAQVRVRLDVPVGGHQLAHEHLQEGGLARAVRPNQGHARVQVHAKVHVLVEQRGVRVGEGDLLHLQHRRGQRPRVRKGEVHGPVGRHLLGQPPADHLLQRLLLGLRLPGQLGRAVPELGDVVLHLLDLVLLVVVPLHLVVLHLLARLHEHVVVARVVGELFVLQVHHVRAHLVQEVLRVAAEEQDLVPVLQVVLQPDHGLHVQVVRGLIHEQQRGLQEQRPRQRDAHAPAARELARLHGLHAPGEPQPVQDLRGARLGRGDVHLLQTLDHHVQAVQDLLVLRVFAELLLQLVLLLLQLGALLVHRHHCLEWGDFPRLDLLRQIEHINVFWNWKGASTQELQESCFATTISAYKAIPVAIVERDVCFFDQGLPEVCDCHV